MKIRRLICAALAASLALCPAAFAADTAPKTDRIAAFAADTPKTDRIVTTQNGTGYSVSSVGRHIIPVSDSSQSFDFSPLDGYDLSTLIISDGKYTDRASVVHLDGDLKLNGITYPLSVQDGRGRRKRDPRDRRYSGSIGRCYAVCRSGKHRICSHSYLADRRDRICCHDYAQ